MDDRGRDRTPVNLEELRKSATKPLREAGEVGGQRFRGPLHAVAYDQAGSRYAVLDTGRQLTAIPSDAPDLELEVGRQYEARSEAQPQREGERRRAIAWQLDDLERVRDLEQGRGR